MSSTHEKERELILVPCWILSVVGTEFWRVRCRLIRHELHGRNKNWGRRPHINGTTITDPAKVLEDPAGVRTLINTKSMADQTAFLRLDIINLHRQTPMVTRFCALMDLTIRNLYGISLIFITSVTFISCVNLAISPLYPPLTETWIWFETWKCEIKHDFHILYRHHWMDIRSTKQIIRYRATATLLWPQIKQY